MSGMTLKQYAQHRFLQLCETYHKLCDEGLDQPGNMTKFIILSVQIHAAKGEVPKWMWRYASRKARNNDRQQRT